MPAFRTSRRVEFADTDMDGIVHFSRYLVFMETAEHELLAHLEVPLRFHHEGMTISWPRVGVQCDYQRAVRFGDVLEIEVAVDRIGEASVTFRHQIRTGGELVAVGRMTTACCAIGGPQGLRAVPIPGRFARRLGNAEPEEMAP